MWLVARATKRIRKEHLNPKTTRGHVRAAIVAVKAAMGITPFHPKKLRKKMTLLPEVSL